MLCYTNNIFYLSNQLLLTLPTKNWKKNEQFVADDGR